MNNLDKLLKGTGVKPHNPLDEMFNNPKNQLDDLFESFGRIFTLYCQDNYIEPKGFHKDQLDKDL